MTQAWGFRKDRLASRDVDLDIRVGSDKTGTRLRLDGRNTCSVAKLALRIEEQGLSRQALHLQGLANGLGKPVLNLSRAQASTHLIHRRFQAKPNGSIGVLIRHLQRLQRGAAIPFPRAAALGNGIAAPR